MIENILNIFAQHEAAGIHFHNKGLLPNTQQSTT